MTGRVLITGVAGFIGAALAERLLARGEVVVGLDNLNDYYDVALKQARVARLEPADRFRFERLDIAVRGALDAVFDGDQFDVVVNLAAQAGVRYSLENPPAYIDANLVGFGNLLEACRRQPPGHLVYASTSSVYGANRELPFGEGQHTDHPISIYAATKKANELMAHSYAHLYRIPCTGLRFFTVYGPWGRPDMALYKFTRHILRGEPIPVFNRGNMVRDFTYIDDIIDGIVAVMDRPAAPDPDWDAHHPDPGTSAAPYRVYNIGNSQPVELLTYIRLIERNLGRRAALELLPERKEDLLQTFANVDRLEAAFEYHPRTPVEVGVKRFVDWYLDFYHCP